MASAAHIVCADMSDRRERLRALLAEQPGDSFLLFALAREYHNAGEFAEAAGAYADLRARDPGYVGLYYHYAAVLAALHREDEAEEVYRAGIRQAEAADEQRAAAELRGALMNWQIERDA